MTSETAPAHDLTGAWGEVTEERIGRPVNYWAIAGAVCATFQVAVLVAWLASGDAAGTPTGPTAVPESMRTAATAQLVVGGVLAALLLGRFLIWPLVADRRLTIDGTFLLGLVTVAWQIVLPNYNQLTMTWNSHYANAGSWGPWLPGWLPPGGAHLAVPLLWVGLVGLTALFIGILGANALMGAVRARHPELGLIGLLGVTFVGLYAAAFVLELAFLRMGVYTYAGGLRSLTLFGGHHYQLPLYQPALLAAAWTGLAAMRFCRNEAGEILPHRGLDRTAGGGVRRALVRLAAVVGLMNVIVFLAWSLPSAGLGVYADEFPIDMLERSYLTNGLCGPNTDYHCPGPDIPIPRPDSAYLRPDGSLGRP